MAEEDKMQEKEVTIVVNGRDKQVTKGELSFAEVVALAYPTPPGENTIFTVTYRHANQHPEHGDLVEGQSVKVKNGTIFNVSPTNRS